MSIRMDQRLPAGSDGHASGPDQPEDPSRLARFVRNNALSLVVIAAFLFILFGQSLAGLNVYNGEQTSHGEPTVSYFEYVRTPHFGEAVFENWESEFLQMGIYVLLTVWLRQRGSAESKDFKEDPADEDPKGHLHDPDAPWPVRRGGWVLTLYSHSLSIALLGLFAISIVVHAVTGAHEYSSEQQAHGEPAVTTLQYVTTSQFWFESLQNWQSEFLAIGAIVVLSIALRQAGSPESKPVHAPHSATGSG